ncbi:hypothetical protein SAMN02927900_06363 [Rhizobium mongolense subsp. loessense]|uniref:Uncharacterized protein n=1 Tax=Rhizobium mongolense subsp. loessense TaxID=158890 RepID=A0A1G4U8N7_9HYPH|nr:hypothetical protein SAMN02927900_06363 [Rhizobium mongolense subsp. loessense]
MLVDMTFVAEPLPGQFGEFNRLNFKVSMAQMATQQPVYRFGILRPLQGRYDPFLMSGRFVTPSASARANARSVAV